MSILNNHFCFLQSGRKVVVERKHLVINTRKHSSRMRTTRFCSSTWWGGSRVPYLLDILPPKPNPPPPRLLFFFLSFVIFFCFPGIYEACELRTAQCHIPVSPGDYAGFCNTHRDYLTQ